jgi:hypothetical protein
MSNAINSAINFANGVLELQAVIESKQREINVLGTQNEGLVERLNAVNKLLMDLKGKLRSQRGMRYEDYNPIIALLDHTLAVAQGRAPATHAKKEPA